MRQTCRRNLRRRNPQEMLNEIKSSKENTNPQHQLRQKQTRRVQRRKEGAEPTNVIITVREGIVGMSGGRGESNAKSGLKIKRRWPSLCGSQKIKKKSKEQRRANIRTWGTHKDDNPKRSSGVPTPENQRRHSQRCHNCRAKKRSTV